MDSGPFIKEWVCFLLSILAFLPSCNRGTGVESVDIQGFAMATTYSVIVDGVQPDSPVAEKLYSEIPEVITGIESKISAFDPESEISRFNAFSSMDWFPVSVETAELVAISLEMSRETSGMFDVTVGSAVEIWGFGAARGSEPDLRETGNRAISASIGYTKLQVRRSPPSLRKSIPDLKVDLSGIAKGYAADRVANIIENTQHHSYNVEIGGEFRTAGLNPKGSPWKIGIEAPADSDLKPAILLKDGAVATSGDYRNFRVIGARRLSHFIDPETGTPIEQKGLSVTVVGRECVRVDAIATALAVAGPDLGYKLASEKDWGVYFIYRSGGAWKDLATATIKPLFSKDSITGIETMSLKRKEQD